jgi:sRNA-binding protein
MSDQFLVRANNGIEVLATHFPAVFALEGWQPHKPLKIGIHKDIAASSIMPAEDIKPALCLYVQRLMYQHALAAGGPRFGLDGEPCGEVTAKHAADAAIAASHIEAKAQAEGAAATAARKAKKPRRIWKVFPDGCDASEPDSHKEREGIAAAPPLVPVTTTATPTEPTIKRLGLGDLKRAAQERRATMLSQAEHCIDVRTIN